MKYDLQLLSYLLLLRYGTLTPIEGCKLILNFRSIAKLVQKHLTTVINLIKEALFILSMAILIKSRTDKSSNLTTFRISFLLKRFKNVLTCLLLRESHFFKGHLMKSKYLHQLYETFTYNIKSSLSRSREVSLRLISLSYTIKLCSIGCTHS